MVVNFRAREISQGARKLARTPTLNKKKNYEIFNTEVYVPAIETRFPCLCHLGSSLSVQACHLAVF